MDGATENSNSNSNSNSNNSEAIYNENLVNTQTDQNTGNYNTNSNVDTQSDKQDHTKTTNMKNGCSSAEDGKYWQARFEKLLDDYTHLQKINQNLEDKLLNVVESFEKKKEELMANNEYEKSTLMADVNKLSTKLVDARIKLHDYEEKEMIHASECNSPCHKDCNPLGLYKSTATTTITNPIGRTPPTQQAQMEYDPNLV